MTGKIIGVSTQTIMRWVKDGYYKYAKEHEELLKKLNLKKLKLMKCIILLLKKQPIWIWKVIDHTSRAFVGWICGDRSTKTLLKLSKKSIS